MLVVLWRHGKAESYSSTGKDEDRKISPQGRSDLEKITNTLKERKLKFQKIYASPLLRARETADIIQRLLSCDEGIEELSELSGGTHTELIWKTLKAKFRSFQSVIIVGHMPDLGYLADYLLEKENVGETSIKAGALIGIELQNSNRLFEGKLVVSLSP